jgi:hypothetical protein
MFLLMNTTVEQKLEIKSCTPGEHEWIAVTTKKVTLGKSGNMATKVVLQCTKCKKINK